MRIRLSGWAAASVSILTTTIGILLPVTARSADIGQLLVQGPVADSCSYCVCDGGTVKPSCQSCCQSSNNMAQVKPTSTSKSRPPAALFNMTDCASQSTEQGASSSKGLREAGWNPYPCCTHCDHCHNDCVATDANGNCTHWKNRCECERHCPCND